ncbi:hypothetical protein ACIQF6_29855 [Kitasatospora sp. NPDC092948]|uniref:hypothetical protein n=1 Tax=Kitasatospora sp. NPDC092948 TaxID=3364088 RepID=UPI00381D4365
MSGENGGPGQQPGGQWGYGQTPGQGYWPGYAQPGQGAPGGGWGHSPWGAAPVAPKPGVVPLRPLAFGEMFGAVFDTIRRYPKALYLPLLAVAGIGAVPVVLVTLLCTGNLYDAMSRLPDDGDPATGQQVWDLLSPILLMGLVFGLVVLAVYVVAGPLSAVVLRAATLGRPMTVGQAWKETRPRLWPVLLSEGMVTLTGGLAYVLALGVPIVLAVQSDSVAPLPFLFILLPTVGVAVLFVTVRLSLQVPVLMLEETAPVAAIRRAWRLNEGNWWRSALLSVVVALVGRFAANILIIPFWMICMGMMPTVVLDDTDTQLSAGVPGAGAITTLVLAGALFGMLLVLVTAPLSPLANGVNYIDRRIRNERLDVALAEAAGIRLSDPAAPPAYPGHPAPPAPAAPPAYPGHPAPPAPAAPPAPPADAPSGPPAPPTKDGSGAS